MVNGPYIENVSLPNIKMLIYLLFSYFLKPYVNIQYNLGEKQVILKLPTDNLVEKSELFLQKNNYKITLVLSDNKQAEFFNLIFILHFLMCF